MLKLIKTVIVILPALFSVVWMVLIPSRIDILDFDPFNITPVVATLVLLVLFVTLNFVLPAFRRDFLELSVLVPCFCAPLAVSGLWTLAPAAMGIGIGGYEYFLHWITKYPNFGPVNLAVLLGFLCVLGLFFLPFLFSLYAVTARKPRLLHLFIFFVADLVLYVAVFIRLDSASWSAIFLQIDNPNVLFLISGPFFRLLPILFMPAFSFFSYFLKNRETE